MKMGIPYPLSPRRERAGVRGNSLKTVNRKLKTIFISCILIGRLANWLIE